MVQLRFSVGTRLVSIKKTQLNQRDPRCKVYIPLFCRFSNSRTLYQWYEDFRAMRWQRRSSKGGGSTGDYLCHHRLFPPSVSPLPLSRTPSLAASATAVSGRDSSGNSSCGRPTHSNSQSVETMADNEECSCRRPTITTNFAGIWQRQGVRRHLMPGI
jgi:hypothetical protein